MIKVKDATKVYKMGVDKIHALDGVNLEVAEGEFVALVGPSGSGKSTLMNVIGALDSLTSGQILVDGEDLSKKNDLDQAKYRRKRIGFIFQTFNLQNNLTALENVELPLVFEGRARKARQELARHALSIVGLSDRARHRPNELSGGQQQRVAIARAIVNNPKILLADEPTGNLDSHTGESVMKLIRDLNKRDKVTVVIVTHNEAHAKYADRVFHMSDGKINREVKR